MDLMSNRSIHEGMGLGVAEGLAMVAVLVFLETIYDCVAVPLVELEIEGRRVSVQDLNQSSDDHDLYTSY